MRYDVCALDDLAASDLKEVEAGGVKILLSRDGERVQAVGASCTHKGAPLKNGTRVGNTVICPWHHAMFDLATGEHVEAPGKGCLSRFHATIEGGRIVLDVPEGAKPHRPEVEPSARRRGGTAVFAIVGAGAAGLACAQELVKQGFDGRIVMISPEDERPYDRTDLSKTYLAGKKPDEKLPLIAEDELTALGIETVVASVERVDAEAHELQMAGGERLRFDKCFVAPGSAAAELDLPNADCANVHRLRSHADAAALKAASASAGHVTVIGAGFIGMEAAAQLVAMGKRVSVVAREKVPFAKRFGAAVAGQIVAQHCDKGVAIHGEAVVESLDAEAGRVVAVRLGSGEIIETDLVILAVGARPRVDILDSEAREGVPVDPFLQFRPDIYAGGDIAQVPLAGQSKPLRIEHWRVAEQHGRQAARAMLGKAEPFAGIPFFWTAQFDRVSYLGHATAPDDVEILGDLGGGSYTAFFIERGTVTAAIGRGKGDLTPALHAVMLSDPAPGRERLDAVGWDPRKLLSAAS